jgi:hypothetical protein
MTDAFDVIGDVHGRVDQQPGPAEKKNYGRTSNSSLWIAAS